MNYSGTGRARQMEFLASRSASVRWTPMDYAGWAVTINKLRCIGLKTHLFTYRTRKEREHANDKEREKSKLKEMKESQILIQ